MLDRVCVVEWGVGVCMCKMFIMRLIMRLIMIDILIMLQSVITDCNIHTLQSARASAT